MDPQGPHEAKPMNLSTEQLDILGHAVAARHEALRSDAQTHTRQLRDDELTLLADGAGDPVDQATAALIHGAENAAVGRDEKELREVEAARARLAAGQYGLCIDCGEEIGFERLIVHPSAARCLFCQELFERTHAAPEGAVST